MDTTKARYVVLLAALLAGPGARAQSIETTPPLAPGDTLRVWSPTPRLDGAVRSLVRLDAREIVIADLATPSASLAVPLGSVRRLEVRRGMRRSPGRIAAGAVIGMAAGALVGAAVGPAIESAFTDGSSTLDGIVGFVFGIGVGGVAGGVTGGIIGAKRRPAWQTVSIVVR